jgi:hypothetical protein
MAYSRGTVYDPPTSDVRIWRHIPLPQFISMLTARSLWFTSVASLADKFEGSYPLADRRARLQFERTIQPYDLPADLLTTYSRHFGSYLLQKKRKSVVVNCWYRGPYESAALWQWSARSGCSVAIRTTFRRLIGSVKTPYLFHAGRVKYLNYQRDRIPGDERLQVFFCKRRHYEHENEVRLLIDRAERAGSEPGLAVRVDLNKLVDLVVVAPDQGEWVRSSLESLVRSHGLVAPVRRSLLSEEPKY